MSTVLSTPSTARGVVPLMVGSTFTAQQMANGLVVATGNFTMDTGAHIGAQVQLAPFNVAGLLFQVAIQNVTQSVITMTGATGITLNTATLAAATDNTLTFLCTAANAFTVYVT